MDRIIKVLTPASSYDMTTIEVIKTELKIPLGDTERDNYFKRQITMASRAVANYCNRDFIAEPMQEQFRPYPFIDSASLNNIPEFLYLSRLPITTITSINISEDTEGPLVEGTDFECDYATGRLIRLYNDVPYRWHFRKLTVQYTGGFTFPGTLPADLQQAVNELVKDMHATSIRDPMIRAQETPGIGRIEYWVNTKADGSAWPPRITDLLSAYIGAPFLFGAGI
jgi:hypothetical protein